MSIIILILLILVVFLLVVIGAMGFENRRLQWTVQHWKGCFSVAHREREEALELNAAQDRSYSHLLKENGRHRELFEQQFKCRQELEIKHTDLEAQNAHLRAQLEGCRWRDWCWGMVLGALKVEVFCLRLGCNHYQRGVRLAKFGQDLLAMTNKRSEQEIERLQGIIAEQSVLLAAAGIDGAYGACQLELPQPEPPQMVLPHYDVVLSENLAADERGSTQMVAGDAERGTLRWDSKAADGLENDWVEDLS